jgi:single-strand DNA-binding protein
MLPTITGEFRVAMDPELRFTPSGMALAKMRAVTSSRKKNDAGEWEDDKQCWVTITAFKQLAENMAESFQKGDLITVTGRLQTEDWEDKDGGKRTSVEVIPFHIGHSIAFDASRSLKGERDSRGSQPSSQQQGTPADDPWAVPSGGGGSQADEPPF